MAMEVLTMHDKSQRDRLFEDLRVNGNELEKQVVKFSGVEPVMVQNTADYEVGQLIDIIIYTKDGTRQATGRDKEKNKQRRPRWRSNWSVAYPTS